jgi:hypothetical protein
MGLFACKWLRAPATTDVDSGPWRITGGCASSLLSQSATADIPGTNPRRMINAYPFMTSRPCISTVCIHANNILVVMTNILLIRAPPRFPLSLHLNRISAPVRTWPTSHQLAA